MATSQDVINAAYLQALGRPADPEGLSFYAGQLESGRAVGDILADLNYAAAKGLDTAPAVQTINLPTTAPADLDTTNLFTGVGTQGATVNQPVAPPPVTAPLTAQDLYNQFLGGRPALEKDVTFWNNYIAQYGPDQAMAAFDAAAQNELGMDLAARAALLREQNLSRDGTVMKDGERTVRPGTLTAQGLYNEFLGGRSALPADIDFWNNYIAVYGPDRARSAFQESAKPEVSAPVEERLANLRAQNLTVPESLLGEFATQRKATPAEVRSMYLSVLGREPDPEGYSYYTSQPVESLRQNFYQGSIPEMQRRVAAIPVTTTIPKPVIGQVSPQSRGQSVDIPGSFVTTNQGVPKPLTVDISTMPREQQDLTSFIVGKMPRPTTTSPGPMFTPGEVNAQLELERLKAMNAPSTTDQGPVAGFAQGGLVNDDINRMLQNQRNAIQRESQSRQMLTNMGAPPVKKFSNGGPAGSSSGVRRLEMSGYQEGGEVTDEMFVGTRPTDETTSPGILPRELREAIDVPLDFANLLIRGTAAVPIGGFAGLYKGLMGGKYGTQEGVKEADTEAARMMAKITGEPKTQTAKDVLQSIGDKMQEYKLDAAVPQLLTLPSPGPGAAAALMRSYELAETPPVGTLKLAGDKGVKPATPPTDQMGFYSPAEKAVMGLPQDKGTASQMLAQITKTQGVKPVELRATGLEDYLKGKGNAPVTKQEIQDFLTNNRVQVDEVVLGKGQILSPEAKRLMGDAEKRMMEADQVMAPFFEKQEAGSLLQGQEPYSTFYRIRGPLSRKIAGGDQEALAELNALNLPPDIRQAVLDFGAAKTEYVKYSSQARKMVKPKFDKYNIPGGQNAREIYLTLPGEQMPSSLPPSVNAQGVLVKPMYATQPKFTAPSPHSVSPEADANRLAHIFLDERKDAKGDNVLFVQEMQSDWAQIGKKKGFQTKTTPYDDSEYKAARARATDLLNEFNRNNTNPVRQQEIAPLLEEARRVEQSFVDNRQRLPSAPFVTNTEDWVNFALKRVIKEAVDNDIDTVAFIKGGQAADKYNLSKQVDSIVYFKENDGTYSLVAIKDGRELVKRDNVAQSALPNLVGKEVADRMAASEGQAIPGGPERELSGENLRVGGEGMKGFYDNILPKTAEKLLKKLGGGKVEQVDIGSSSEKSFGVSFDTASKKWEANLDNKPIGFFASKEEAQAAAQAAYDKEKTSYLGFKITPEMKEMVKTEGLPKFAAGGEVTDFIKRAA